MPEQLTDRIEKLFEAHDILRLKGFAAIQGRDMRLWCKVWAQDSIRTLTATGDRMKRGRPALS